MNYTNYTIKSSIERYKKDIIVSILYIISLFSVYYFTYDKGTLETYYITSIRLKSNIYNIDDKEMSHISGCCRGKRNYAYGFKWTFYNVNRDNSTIL